MSNNKLTDNEWHKILTKFPEATFLQSPAYAEMNESLGYKTISTDFSGKGLALMIIRDAKRGRYMEIPCGPLIDWDNKDLVKNALTEIGEIAKEEKCVFVRIRPQLMANARNLKKLEELGLKKSPMHLAAEHTVIINLDGSEEELLSNMRRQTRYEVRRADKLGIEVTKSNSKEMFEEFHNVQVETAKRQGFVPPDLKTLMAEKEAFGKNAQIYVAKINRENVKDSPEGLPEKAPVAYGLIIGDGREGDYYEAASTDLNRKLPGAYALLWRVMRDLKADGYERFTLWWIAPAGQPNHRYAGVTTFKTGFGGEVVEYVPAHDLIISKIGYLKDFVVETARKKRRHL